MKLPTLKVITAIAFAVSKSINVPAVANAAMKNTAHASTCVKAAGTDLVRMLFKKPGFKRSLFGCKDKNNEPIPIVKSSQTYILLGVNGYWNGALLFGEDHMVITEIKVNQTTNV